MVWHMDEIEPSDVFVLSTLLMISFKEESE